MSYFSISNVSKSYDDIPALQPFSLELDQGDFFLLYVSDAPDGIRCVYLVTLLLPSHTT